MSELVIEAGTVDQLRSTIDGDVVIPDDPAYEDARKVWNGMVDRRPTLIVRCRSTADVVAALNFGREHKLPIAVRCGGHSTPGYSTCDDGIVIDLRPMNRVDVDPKTRTARVQGGTIWSELDQATGAHGLAVTGGRVSDTGVGGLALGSGSGWLERMYGVTCESIVSAEVVTAEGDVVSANNNDNPDLLWGLRGGGGNFGIVTEFEFRLHHVGELMTAGMLMYPRSKAPEVIRNYRDFIAGAPDEVGGGVAMLTAPPEEFVPEELRGQPAVGVIYCYVGPVEEGQRAAQPLIEFGAPAVNMIQPMPYAALQSMLDAGNPHGIHEYFKIDALSDLSDQAIDTAIAQAENLPMPFGQLVLAPMGGAMTRGNADAMALTVPDTPWVYHCLAMWMDPTEDEASIAWARGFADAMRKFGVDSALPNFIEPDEGVSRLRASYGEDKFARLQELKRQWDPGNLFRLNQNIDPTG